MDQMNDRDLLLVGNIFLATLLDILKTGAMIGSFRCVIFRRKPPKSRKKEKERKKITPTLGSKRYRNASFSGNQMMKSVKYLKKLNKITCRRNQQEMPFSLFDIASCRFEQVTYLEMF